MDSARPVRFTNIGVDTGGTFTDLVLIDDQGVIRTEKSFSTPENEGYLTFWVAPPSR